MDEFKPSTFIYEAQNYVPNVAIKLLNKDACYFRENAILKFCFENYDSTSRLFENLAENGYCIPAGQLKKQFDYSYLEELDIDNPIIFFESSENDDSVFIFENFQDLFKVISECSIFTYYITNENIDWVICCTCEDVIIGVGDAKKWLRNLYKNT